MTAQAPTKPETATVDRGAGFGPLLGVDVDSTIYDLTGHLILAAREITGEELRYEDVDSWGYIFDRFGTENGQAIFERALEPSRVSERELYDNVLEALFVLRAHGVRLHFISHNHDPSAMQPHLTAWLNDLFGSGAMVTVLHSDASKLRELKRHGAVGIVDDKPQTLAEVADAGLLAATLIHPWNRSLVASRDDIIGFPNWRVGEEVLLDALDALGHLGGGAYTG